MNTFEDKHGHRGGRFRVVWGIVGLAGAILASGCSPSGYLARRMLQAPNRVPDFVKPEGRVWLGWDAGVIERFPSGTHPVGRPSVDLHWVAVEPADYGWASQASTSTNRGRVMARFRYEFTLPPEGLPPAKPAIGTAYLLHGYGVDLETLFPWATYLAEAGWRAVLIDLPGHGGSGGREVSFGVREGEYLREFRETLGARRGWSGPSVAVGHSMGAALALRWQASDAGISASVAFGPYSEFVPAALRLRDDYAKWVPRGWVRNAAAKVPGLLGVEPECLDTCHAIRGRSLRAMLVASRDDVVTPPEDSQVLRSELGEGSAFLIVGDASHETLPFVFSEHGRRVVDWLSGVVTPAVQAAGGRP